MFHIYVLSMVRWSPKEITQHQAFVQSWRFGTTYPFHVDGPRNTGSVLYFLALEDGTDRLSRNVATELPLKAT
jgi:hypothetical protein